MEGEKPIISMSSSIHCVECKEAWELLTEREQNYAYFFLRGAWEGSKISYFQRSFESPPLFVLFRTVFNTHLPAYKNIAMQNGVTEDEWTQLMVYAAALFQNTGNYKSFGDTKFIPELNPTRFMDIIQLSPNYNPNKALIDELWEEIKDILWKYEVPYKALGFCNDKGTTTYYSSNVTKTDAEFIKKFMLFKNIDPINTRLFKLSENEFDILIASEIREEKEEMYEGKKIHIKKGDYSPLMRGMNKYLKEAKEYTANDIQTRMMNKYIEHFEQGDVDLHKDSQREWVTDKNPVVETNIGFIETYVDPLGVRAEYEGFVALVHKKESEQFAQLVTTAPQLIERLPWPKEFENIIFKQPDFTSIQILGFGASGTPIGINIPNYEDMREEIGYKNVNLSNIYPLPKKENIKFLNEVDTNLFIKHYKTSLLIVVALHELIGHGTGKILKKKKDGTTNFPLDLKNPFTGEPTGFYEENEDPRMVLGELYPPYEECRADSIALFLSCFCEPFDIFFPDYSEDMREELLYVIWLEMAYAGLKALEYYDPAANKWGQAHVTAAYAILKVYLEANPGFIQIEDVIKDQKPGINIHLDRNQIKTVGFKAISDFILKLHVYKSMGDKAGATEFFSHYTEVDEKTLKLREIVLAHKVPRRLELQPNVIKRDGKYEYIDHEDSFQGIVESYTSSRFDAAADFEVFDLWKKEKEMTRPNPI